MVIKKELHQIVEQLIEKDKALESKLPPRPEEPLPQDCCGCSCSPCVFDMYRSDLDEWARQCLRQIKPANLSELVPPDLLLSLDELESSARTKSVALTTLNPNSYRKFKLITTLPVTDDTLVYRFELEKNAVLGLPVGKHLIVKGHTDDGKVITRQYTPVSPSYQKRSFDLMIKLYEHGKMSSYVRTLVPKSMVEMRGPFGKFEYKANEYSDILMLAAGTGITPMAQVTCHVLDDESDNTRLRLLYACHTYRDILLKNRIDEWRQFWNFTVCYFLNQKKEDVSTTRFNEELKFQKIDQSIITEEIDKLKNTTTNYLILICGTKSFEKDMFNYATKCGVLARRLFKF